MGGIYLYRCGGKIQAGVYRNVWSRGEMVRSDRALRKTDTVGVSADILIPSYLFISSCHLLCVFIAKLDFQLNLALEKHDILPFQTYCCLAFFFFTTSDNKIAAVCLLGDNLPHWLLGQWSVYLFVGEFKDFCHPEGHSYLLLVVKLQAAALTGHREEALSVTASKHFFLGGRVTGSLWRGLFVRGFLESDLSH